jgi:hypothetical protein
MTTFEGRIRTTYEVVTPESAEHGDVAESGWLDEEGTLYSVRDACRKLQGCEPSSSQFHPGLWYIGAGDSDYSDGSETRESYHLVACDWSEARQREVYCHVTAGTLPDDDE